MPNSAGFGPLGPRATFVRPPANQDAYGGLQTWFKNCSAPGGADGTVPDASFFNHYIGNIVYAAAKAGVTLTNDQANDTFIYQIIQGLIGKALANLSAGTGGGGDTGGGDTGGNPSWTLI